MVFDLLFLLLLFFGYTMWHVGVLVPQPGIGPASPVVEAQIPHRFLTIGLPGKYLS